MSDWSPEQYLKFERERTQPAKDLAARLERCPIQALDVGRSEERRVGKECM